MGEEIPQWAKDRVVALMRKMSSDDEWGDLDYALSHAFACYIMEHEHPPIDPLLLEAREIVAKWYQANPDKQYVNNTPANYRDGSKDAGGEVQQALAALRRGLELAQVSA